MQKTILTFLLIFMGWASLFAEDEMIIRNNVPLNHKVKPINDQPRAPARIPVVCSHDNLSFYLCY